MSAVWLEIYGKVPLQMLAIAEVEAVQQVVDRFNEVACGPLLLQWIDAGVSISGGIWTSHADTLVEILKQLEPYVARPCFLDVRIDSQEDRIYIGPLEREKEARSQLAREQIEQLLLELIQKDVLKLTHRLREI